MSPVWPRSKIAWTGVPHRFRNDFDLSAVKGDGRPQDSKCFADGLDKLRRARALAASVRGPSDWESVIRKHREVLNISLDPPRNETDITQNKKFRQCVFAEVAEVVRKGFAARREKKLRQQERVDTRTRLRSEKAVIYSPRFAFPHFSDRREFAAGHSGEGRESDSGGRAAWASFF